MHGIFSESDYGVTSSKFELSDLLEKQVVHRELEQLQPTHPHKCSEA